MQIPPRTPVLAGRTPWPQPASRLGHGVNVNCLVGLLSAYSNRTDLLYDLQEVRRKLGQVSKADEADRQSVCSTNAVARRRMCVAEQLGAKAVDQLVADFMAGTTRQALANRHKVSVSSVARLLRQDRQQRRQAS